MSSAEVSRELVDVLDEAGVGIDPVRAQGIIAGIVAGPERRKKDWLKLLGLDEGAPGSEVLVEYVAQARKSFNPGYFEAPAPSSRLAALRAELAKRKLDGFVVPRTDEFQGEAVPSYAERLRWLTGFSGSAGVAVVASDRAAVFVDGRYTLQVRNEVDVALFTPLHLIDEPPTTWIAANFSKGARIGYDPALHTRHGAARLHQAARSIGAEMVRVETNPVDAVWQDQPPVPIVPVLPHPDEYAGEDAHSKRLRIGQAVASFDAEAAVIAAPDSLAWLLNIRGGDVPRSPLPLGFVTIYKDGSVDLFMDERKIPEETRRHLGNAVTLYKIEDFGEKLTELGKGGARILADPSTTNSFVFDKLAEGGATIVEADDPCLLPKACKNDVELAGTRAAHARDGAALSRFMAWLDDSVASGEEMSEIKASDRLEAFRAEAETYRDLSFDTIAGSGPNGAIVHYRASGKSDRPIRKGEIFLLDSGGQYLDGTTDVTRTFCLGEADAEVKDRFTRVLKGHIALALAQFPEGTTGSQLDPLARAPLWAIGLDYDHGTGHGVGSYLNVHEGPQRISKVQNNVALKPGMIVSNEPGYYREGAYGIRIENLVAVKEVGRSADGRKALLGFETLTLAPIDRRLVDKSLLDQKELDWLNAYHARVLETVAPQVDDGTRRWLEQACAPI